MNLLFPDMPGLNYKRLSQRIRVLSEQWFYREMYCPSCGGMPLSKFPNNTKLADFFCEQCGEIYELKSKGGSVGKKILDGAYYTALERITGNANPNLFVLSYHENTVMDLTVVPKHFFTPDTLRIRKALSPDARRAGYVGSFILYDRIPEHGKIPVVRASVELDKSTVLKNYRQAEGLKVRNMDLRGWLMDILRCADRIRGEVFSLRDMYAFS